MTTDHSPRPPVAHAGASDEVVGETTAHVPSKRPAVKIAGPYGHPFHPQLVTLPIGAWTASLIFDLAARLGWVDEQPAAFAAFWLLVIGCVGAVLAAVFGVMDLTTIPDRTRANRTAVAHGTINSLAAVLLALSAFVRYAQGDVQRVPDLGLALSVAGLLVLVVGGWLGGKLAYTYGVRVAREPRQEEGYRPNRL